MNASADARASATESGVSPRIRKRNWSTALALISRVVKNRRRYRPRARWNTDAPCSIVLSTSKNAAECTSGGVARAASTSAAAAAASPASTDRARRSRVDGRVMGRAYVLRAGSAQPEGHSVYGCHYKRSPYDGPGRARRARDRLVV